MRRILTPLLACAALAAAAPAVALPRLAVYVDHSAKLQIGGSVGSVIVGDPAVADVVVVDRRTIFVQGKGYGETEVVVLDTEGRTVWQGDVAVVAPDQGRVSVVRGPAGPQQSGGLGGGGAGVQVTEMTCAGYCAPAANGPGGKSTTGSTPSINLGR